MVYFLYPETKGLSLEQIDHIFEGKGHGWDCLTQGVKESIKGPVDLGIPERSSVSQVTAAKDEEKALGRGTAQTSEGIVGNARHSHEEGSLTGESVSRH